MTPPDEQLATARAALEIAREGDTGEMQAMILAHVLLGKTENDQRAAYDTAVSSTVIFTQLSEPDVAAGYAAAARWMLAHRWHK